MFFRYYVVWPVFGRLCLWPFGLWPFRFVTVLICGRYSVVPLKSGRFVQNTYKRYSIARPLLGVFCEFKSGWYSAAVIAMLCYVMLHWTALQRLPTIFVVSPDIFYCEIYIGYLLFLYSFAASRALIEDQSNALSCMYPYCLLPVPISIIVTPTQPLSQKEIYNSSMMHLLYVPVFSAWHMFPSQVGVIKLWFMFFGIDTMSACGLRHRGQHSIQIQWNLFVTTTVIIKFITCDSFSYVF